MSGGQNGGFEKLLNIQGELTFYTLMFDVVDSVVGKFLAVVNTVISVLDSLLNCPDPAAKITAILAIMFLITGLGVGFIFGTIFTPLVGVFISTAYGFAMGIWLDEVKKFNCP